MKYSKIILGLGLGVALVALAMNSCGGSASSSAVAPTGLGESVISSPFAATSASSYSFESKQKIFATTYSERKAAIAALISAGEISGTDAASCTFALGTAAFGSGRADCYGNLVIFTGGDHPDGVYNDPDGGGPRKYSLPGGDVGIWGASNSTGESCVAAQVTELVDNFTGGAYVAQLSAASLYCYMKASGISIPDAEGETVSLSATQVEDFSFTDEGGSAFTVSSASVDYIEDSAGNAGYKMTLLGTMTVGGSSQDFKMIVRYVGQDDGGYSGTISYYYRFASVNDSGHCGAETGSTNAGSMIFSKADSASDVQVALNTARYCGATYEPFIATNDQLEPCDKYGSSSDVDSSATNGWGSDWNRLVFNYDPETLVGKYSFAWMAGNADGWTRTFNAAITDASTGVGYFGFGPDISTISGGVCTKSSDIGKITKMICNWAGPGTNRQPVDLVQKQTISKSSGKWVAATSNITFSPTNTCDQDGTGAEDVVYCSATTDSGTCPGTDAYTNDNVNGSSVTQNLESIANYTTDFGSQPTAPTF